MKSSLPLIMRQIIPTGFGNWKKNIIMRSIKRCLVVLQGNFSGECFPINLLVKQACSLHRKLMGFLDWGEEAIVILMF